MGGNYNGIPIPLNREERDARNDFAYRQTQEQHKTLNRLQRDINRLWSKVENDQREIEVLQDRVMSNMQLIEEKNDELDLERSK